MLEQTIDCIVASPDGTRPIHVVRPDGLAALLDTLPAGQAAFLRDTGFTGKAGELRFLPGPQGVAGAVLGIGSDTSPFVFGNLPAATAGHRPVAAVARRVRRPGGDAGVLPGGLSLQPLRRRRTPACTPVMCRTAMKRVCRRPPPPGWCAT